MQNEIPSEEDWENYQEDFDANYAHRIFAGKSNDEVQPDFKRSVLERVSELRFMPIRPFQYYVFGLKQYIDTADFGSFDSSDAINGLITLVEDVLKKNPDYVIPVLDDLMPTLEHIAENQLDYGADIDIYGYFPVILDRIKEFAKNA